MPQMFIGSFNLCNLVHVFEADGPNCLVAWSAGSLLDACCLFEKVRHRWGFRDEGEGSIGLYGDQGGDWGSGGDVGRSSVELLAKVHRPHAASAESGANGRGWSGLACGDEETLLTGDGVGLKLYRRKEGRTTKCGLAGFDIGGGREGSWHVREGRGVPRFELSCSLGNTPSPCVALGSPRTLTTSHSTFFSTNRFRLDDLACHFGTFPALTLLNVGKVSCAHNAVIQVKGVFQSS